MAVEVARSELSVRYAGPSLTDGRMDVRTLAPALLGLAESIQEAGRTLYPGAPDVTLEIVATERGSFVVKLDLAQMAVTAGVIFASDPATALANVKAVLFDPAVGVVRYLRARRAQPEPEPDADGSVTFRDGERELTFPADVVRAGTSVSIRTGLASLVEPLGDDAGIDTCEIVFQPQTEPLRLTAADTATFEPDLPPDDPIADDTFTAQLRIVSMAFDPGLAWRFDDGQSRFPARITDPTFDEVLAKDSFRRDDRLRAKVRRRQWDRAGSLTTQYEVVEVLRHEAMPPPGQQLSLE